MDTPRQTLRVWDLPTRAFHWTLAATVIGMLITAWIGGRAMAWHIRLGYLASALLIFRLLWGVVGGHWSRFAQFPLGAAAWRSLRAGAWSQPGHSPLGALSVVAILGVLLMQIATGLFSEDQIEFAGPLATWVSEAQSRRISGFHKSVGQYLVLAWIGLHVAAIAFYRWVKQRRLVSAMVHGDQEAADEQLPSSADGTRERRLAAAVFVACLVGVLIAVRSVGAAW